MKIEVGKYYRARDGRKVGPIGYNPNITNYWKFFSGVTFWDEFGRLYKATRETDLDLIAEWTEPTRASDTPKTWGEMTDAEKGELLLAYHEGKVIQWEYPPNPSGWGKPSRQNLWKEEFAYRIKQEPVRETVTLYGYVQIDGNGAQFDNCWGPSSTNTHRITFTTTDGKPDLDSIKMEEV